MRIIARSSLEAFWNSHADSKQALLAWHDEAKAATWMSPQAIKDQYASASFIGNNRVVFNIKGGHYRLITAVSYKFSAIYIKFIGTHAEYNKIDAATVEHTP